MQKWNRDEFDRPELTTQLRVVDTSEFVARMIYGLVSYDVAVIRTFDTSKTGTGK